MIKEHNLEIINLVDCRFSRLSWSRKLWSLVATSVSCIELWLKMGDVKSALLQLLLAVLTWSYFATVCVTQAWQRLLFWSKMTNTSEPHIHSPATIISPKSQLKIFPNKYTSWSCLSNICQKEQFSVVLGDYYLRQGSHVCALFVFFVGWLVGLSAGLHKNWLDPETRIDLRNFWCRSR